MMVIQQNLVNLGMFGGLREAGKTLVVTGESGCGKTVLPKLIIGLLRPTAGKVFFDGNALVDLPDHELMQRGCGLAFYSKGRRFSTACPYLTTSALACGPSVKGRKRNSPAGSGLDSEG